MFDAMDLFSLSPTDFAYAKELRDRGFDDDTIAGEVRWRQKISIKVLSSAGTLAKQDGGPIEELRAQVQTALKEKTELQRRLALVEAERDQALSDHNEDKLAGKLRQTFLKMAFLVGEAHGFVLGKSNGAVSKIKQKFEDLEIDGEDDEAFRNVLKEAYSRKQGGHWKRKRD